MWPHNVYYVAKMNVASKPIGLHFFIKPTNRLVKFASNGGPSGTPVPTITQPIVFYNFTARLLNLIAKVNYAKKKGSKKAL